LSVQRPTTGSDELLATPLGLRLSRAAEMHPDREALVFLGQRFSYAQLDAWQRTIQGFLADRSVVAGERVLWQLPNLPEALVIHCAIARAGCVSIPVPMLCREHELTQIVRDSRPSAIISIGDHRGRCPAREVNAALDAAGHFPLLRGCVGDAPSGWVQVPEVPGRGVHAGTPAGFVHSDADDPVLIMYTSGTTAEPKGVVHTSRSLANLTSMLSTWCGLNPESSFITAAPVAHIAGMLAMSFLPLACGGKAVMMESWEPKRAVELIDSERVTFSCGASLFLRGLVEEYEAAGPEGFRHRLSEFICGGTAIPSDLIIRASRTGIAAFRSWGMTESPMIGMAHLDDPLEIRAFTDGRICPDGEVQAVDDQRRPLPEGEIGDLRIRTPQMMRGYTNDELNLSSIDSEGWYYSGDVGFVDSNGCVTMTSRTKDIINRAGEKFSAQDIENAVSSHSAIAVAAVIAVDDPRLGEVPACFVQLRPGTDWPGEQALIEHLEDRRLARQKIPVHWSVIDEVPVTPAGKLKKDALRLLFEQGRAIGAI
jgi:acyl-CoA synthetase